MPLHAHHDLLCHKPVPATERLSVFAGVRIVVGHIAAHDVGGVLSNFQTGFKAILQLHAHCIFRIDRGPLFFLANGILDLRDLLQIG